jgi:hypothetical protein
MLSVRQRATLRRDSTTTTLGLFVGTVIGGAATYALTRSLWRTSTTKLLEDATERHAAELAEARDLLGALSPDDYAETLRFLYDKRLTLFNTRREHEWKIYFGALTLLGAADAVIVAGDIILSNAMRCGWIAACAVVFLSVIGYEIALQIRNDADRVAMDRLFNRLCGMAKVNDAAIRESDHDAPRGLLTRYGWAFPWQMLLLLLVAVISGYLPWIACRT